MKLFTNKIHAFTSITSIQIFLRHKLFRMTLSHPTSLCSASVRANIQMAVESTLRALPWLPFPNSPVTFEHRLEVLQRLLDNLWRLAQLVLRLLAVEVTAVVELGL